MSERTIPCGAAVEEHFAMASVSDVAKFFSSCVCVYKVVDDSVFLQNCSAAIHPPQATNINDIAI